MIFIFVAKEHQGDDEKNAREKKNRNNTKTGHTERKECSVLFFPLPIEYFRGTTKDL